MYRMKTAVAGLLLSGSVVCADQPAVRPEVDIVVDGHAVRKYAAANAWYVEALKGKEYEIRLRNPWGVRVAVALSVDGLNTIDAAETSAAAARKWVLGPYETVTIRGWQTSMADARRFFFTSEPDSYAQRLGKKADLGIISAVFYRERIARPLTSTRRDTEDRMAQSAPSPDGGAEARMKPSAPAEAAAAAPSTRAEEFAATGMGHRTDHVVTQVRLDLEDSPASSVDLRYEFRSQLVRLGILSAPEDPLARRERAQGFQPGFCPPLPEHR